jgi:glutathione S-transferase
MKLYVFPVAPNPTKVRLYVAEKRAAGGRLDVEEVTVSLPAGEQKQPAHLARNPAGKLPVLELPGGGYLTESLAIIEYLEEIAPEPSLWGRTPAARARVRELERIADLGVLIGMARIVHTTRSPLGLPAIPAIAEHARAELPVTLGRLEAVLADGRPFLAGEAPTVADCTLAAGFQFGRFGKVPLPEGFPHLERWDARYRARDAARSVLVA